MPEPKERVTVINLTRKDKVVLVTPKGEKLVVCFDDIADEQVDEFFSINLPLELGASIFAHSPKLLQDLPEPLIIMN